jgi:hypothetical protein
MVDLTNDEQQVDTTTLTEDEIQRQLAEQIENTTVIKINPIVEGFSFDIQDVEIYNTKLHLSVIKRILWCLKLTEGEYSAHHYGLVTFPTVTDDQPIENFKFLEDITSEKVIEWIYEQNPKMDALEKQLQLDLFEKKRMLKAYPSFCQMNIPKQ